MRFVIATALAMLLAPASAGAQSIPPSLSMYFGDKDPKAKRVVDYGRPATAGGRLSDDAGNPVPNATLKIIVLELRDGAVEQDGGTVTTKADGTFKVVIPPGPSRRVTVTSATPALSASVDLSVRAGVTLKARPRQLHTGQQLRLSGKLRGGSQPAAGKVIDLQVRRDGRWRTFADVRTHSGTFSFRYRFSKVRTMRRLLFRAVVPRFGG